MADQAVIAELLDCMRVLRNEAVETRKVLKMLVGVIGDSRQTNELLRQELQHIRTLPEQDARVAALEETVARLTNGGG